MDMDPKEAKQHVRPNFSTSRKRPDGTYSNAIDHPELRSTKKHLRCYGESMVGYSLRPRWTLRNEGHNPDFRYLTLVWPSTESGVEPMLVRPRNAAYAIGDSAIKGVTAWELLDQTCV